MKIRLFIPAIIVLIIVPFSARRGWAFAAETVVGKPLSRIWESSLIETKSIQTNQTGCGRKTVPAINEEFEQRVVELVNQARADNGLPPLKRSKKLDQAARFHAADMAQEGYFDHDTYDLVDGQLVKVCSTWDRIGTYYKGANAENIAAGYSTPEDVVQGWLDSEGHRDNILNSYSWEIGVGFYQGPGPYTYYWVQDFGRGDDYPVIINGESAATDSPEVSIYVYGEFKDMQLRTDDDPWTGWQNFTPAISWTLDGGDGEHTVSVMLRDNSNQTVTSSDSIYLDGPAQSNQPVFTIFLPEVHQ